VAFEIARNFVFANFWISGCNSLVLDWGWDRFQSERSSLRLSSALGSFSAWNFVSYSATDDLMGRKIRIFANEHLRDIGTSEIKVNAPDSSRDFIGSYKD
jgi:hypothetical protein